MPLPFVRFDFTPSLWTGARPFKLTRLGWGAAAACLPCPVPATLPARCHSDPCYCPTPPHLQLSELLRLRNELAAALQQNKELVAARQQGEEEVELVCELLRRL